LPFSFVGRAYSQSLVPTFHIPIRDRDRLLREKRAPV
jgi:hypothetical protein